jgi:Heterokaryon incompatibility protein (HET)
MRLIKYEGHGSFSLVEHDENNVPRYAILSHTWGADSEEVTFKDLMKGTGKNKAGYKKMEFCGQQAGRDSLQHFWVDTCCINKSSSAELTEAINSMFRWYQNASKCYVYLSDVSTNYHNQNNLSFQSWETAFRNSRWFTRGWTLQELIAPPSVEFFSSERQRLGDKKSLVRQVHEVTGVAVKALEGNTLSEFSVAERMLWAEKRETRRGEDKAYSLLGIFNIYMPLIYGEGMENALRRLREEIDSRLLLGKSIICVARIRGNGSCFHVEDNY